MNDVTITFDTSKFEVEAIHTFLANTYWSTGIPIDVVKRAIAGSLCVGAFFQGAQIGFARLITDRATFAYLADVFVLPDHRGKGIARRMLEQLFGHPEVQGLRRMMLATQDAHDLYAKFGFVLLAAPARWMELHRPNIYAQNSGVSGSGG